MTMPTLQAMINNIKDYVTLACNHNMKSSKKHFWVLQAASNKRAIIWKFINHILIKSEKWNSLFNFYAQIPHSISSLAQGLRGLEDSNQENW